MSLPKLVSRYLLAFAFLLIVLVGEDEFKVIVSLEQVVVQAILSILQKFYNS
jgi:hypothetical protein